MGNIDSIPIISQVKSLVQAIAGDSDEARETQENFVKGCPVVSQVVSLGAVIGGDTDYAREAQIYFGNGMSHMADSIPIVGHVKGAIHYACGDTNGGDNAMKAASRTIGVVASGIGGFAVGGPVGAIAGGIAGGAAMDGAITGIDSAVHNEYRPYGHIDSVTRAIEGNMTPGDIFDWASVPVFDGAAGYGSGRSFNKLKTNRTANKQMKNTIAQAIENGRLTLEAGQTVEQLAREIQKAAREMKKVTKIAGSEEVHRTTSTRIIDVEDNAQTGFSFRLREALQIDAFENGLSSTQQILREKYPNGAPKIRGEDVGQPQCAEHHALHQFHKANGKHATPKLMITIQYDGQNFQAFARCDNCKKIGRLIPMGNVMTDAIHGMNIPVGAILNKRVLYSLLAEFSNLCDCDESHSDDDKE